jgi:hypothetical protein
VVAVVDHSMHHKTTIEVVAVAEVVVVEHLILTYKVLLAQNLVEQILAVVAVVAVLEVVDQELLFLNIKEMV